MWANIAIAGTLYKNKGYPFSTKIPHTEISTVARRFSRYLPVGNRLCLNGLFEQTVENQAARIGSSVANHSSNWLHVRG
jgi:hypothetical protein